MNWTQKLGSRKFWESLIGFTAGLMTLFGGPSFDVEVTVQRVL